MVTLPFCASSAIVAVSLKCSMLSDSSGESFANASWTPAPQAMIAATAAATKLARMVRRTGIQRLDDHGGAVAKNLGRTHHGTRVVAHDDDGVGPHPACMRDHEL